MGLRLRAGFNIVPRLDILPGVGANDRRMGLGFVETQPANQDREELLELYKLALEDYRFQVQLNWGRSQYFLVLNIGVIGIATGIVQLGRGEISILVGFIYLVGVFFSIFSILALQSQRKFYRAARDQKQWFEDQLDLGAAAITPAEHSTTKMSKVWTFKAFVNFMFVLLGALNLFASVFVFLH